MSKPTHPDLDAPFLARQRERLLALRAQLIKDGDAAGVDEDTLQQAAGGEPQDAADDGNRLEQQANDESLLARNEARVVTIDRALAKLDEHTYGLSDGNGEPIAKAHLEVVPEAIYTTDELQAMERRR